MKFECNGKEESPSDDSGGELKCKKSCTNCEDCSCTCKCHQKDDDVPVSEDWYPNSQ